MNERYEVVDENDNPTGQLVTKEEAHAGRFPHRISAVFVTNSEGKLYVQVHKVSGGKLDHTVGGHVDPGETYEEAAYREMDEEIGLKNVQLERIAESIFSDEGDRIHIFGIYHVTAPEDWKFTANDEVEELQLMDIQDVLNQMKNKPELFTNGFINTMKVYRDWVKLSTMKDYRAATIGTYNRSAHELAVFFQGIGPRVRHIDTAFEFAGNPVNPKVVEIGCGDGRDATDIVTRTNRYTGFDISEAMVKIAQNALPDEHFEVADAVTYEYPKETDIVFAFASILHLNKNEFASVLDKVHTALNPGGILYISTKHAVKYGHSVTKDSFGERLFYYYNAAEICKLARGKYTTVFTDIETIGRTQWLEIALKKSKYFSFL